MRQRIDRAVLLGVGLLTALMVATAATSYVNTRTLQKNADRVAVSRDLIDSIHAVQFETVRLQADLRAYVVTGFPEYIASYEATAGRLRAGAARLGETTAGDPEHGPLTQTALEQIESGIAGLDAVAKMRRTPGGQDAIVALFRERAGRSFVDPLLETLSRMEGIEHERHEQREAEALASYRKAILYAVAAAALGLVAVTLFVITFARSERSRARAAERLDTQRELLSATLTSIGDAVIATDSEGCVTFMNPVAERLTGWPQAEAQGKPLDGVFHIVNETTRATVENPAARALKGGAIVGLANHTVLLSRSGDEVPIDDSAAQIRSGGSGGSVGSVTGAVLVFRDISERKRAESSLASATAETGRQKRLYETVLSAIHDFVYVFSLDHRVLYANEALVRMWGHSLENTLGKTFLEIGYEAWHAEMHCREIDTVRTTKKPLRGEVPFNGTLGRRIYDYIFVPVFGSDGEVEAVAGTTRDVTERKAGEDKLRLLDALNEAIRPAADPAAVMAATTRLLGEHLDVTRCAYADLEADGDRFTIRHDWTAPGAASTVGTYSLEAFGPRAVADQRAGRTLAVRNVDRELAPEEGGDTFRSIGIRSLVCCPLVKSGRLVGMMAVHQSEPREWTAGEVSLVEEVAERSWAHLERLRAEAEARAADERVLAVLEGIDEGFAVFGKDWRFEYVNPAFERLNGIRREDVLGKVHWDVYPETLGTILELEYRKAAADRVTVAFENHYAPWDRWFALKAYPAAGGGVTVQFRDVTEGKRAAEREQRAAEANAKFRTFFEQGTQFAGLMTPDGTVIEANRLHVEACGYTRAEVIGRKYWECGWWAASAELVEVVRGGSAEAAAGRLFRRESPYALADGSRRVVDLTLAPVTDDDGRVLFVATTGTDVTDRVRAESALRFLADASASLAELVDYESTLGRIANLAVGRFADWCIVDLVDETGKRKRLAVKGEESAAGLLADTEDDLAVGFPHVLRTGEPEVVPDLAAIDVESSTLGRERIERLRAWRLNSYLAVPLLSRGRVIGGMTFLSASPDRHFGATELGIATDLAGRVTVALENAQLYRTLQDQDRRKDEFLATLAHELRNPLAPVRNGIQILRVTMPADERMQKALSMMDRQLGHMVHLVDDLMDVARVSSGKVVLRKERVDLRAVVDAAMESTRQVVEAGGHTLRIDVPEATFLFEADKTRLVQILTNLLSNAAKYTPQGGRISVAAERSEGFASIHVTDNGIGIAAGMLPKVFDMFTQVGTSLERSQGGLGIGLTLVKRLVEMHGGTVHAESPGAGQGSTFVVRLPLLAAGSSDQEATSATDLQTPSQLKVLVVDDNLDAAESLALLLELKGHEVRTAHDGPDALRVLGSFLPDLVLLDIGLPGMTGYEVARRIRESQAVRGVTLAALTGWGQDEDRRRSREAGFDYHLTKPADPVELDRILGEVCIKQATAV